ncbi:MAG: TraB/GumN family protein, partial [Methyloceanibacter sp.]
NRNKNWAGWISERMKQPGVVFIAVGAGHLAGADSVQAQLKAYRLKARRVKY